jgi:hypothetical protein
MVTQENDAGGEDEMGAPLEANQVPAQPPQEYLQPILRASSELMIRFDGMAEVYAKNVEAIIAETALCRKELEESRKDVNELHKEIANLKELIQSLSLGASTILPSTQASSLGRS